MMGEPSIQQALAEARGADLAIVGIGNVSGGSSAAILASIGAKAADLAAFALGGPVGDISGRYYDSQGKPVAGEIDDRIRGLTLGEIAEIPLVMGIADGVAKAEAVLGALRSGVIDVLVCDAALAEAVLARN